MQSVGWCRRVFLLRRHFKMIFFLNYIIKNHFHNRKFYLDGIWNLYEYLRIALTWKLRLDFLWTSVEVSSFKNDPLFFSYLQ